MWARRAPFAAVCLAAAMLLGFGYWLQLARDLEPCNLCIFQRWFFMGLAGAGLLGAVHGPRAAGARVYAALILVLSLGGLTVAGRQVWLQHLPADRVPECGPGLEFMLEMYPPLEVIGMVFRGSGECAEVVWRFLGLSIPQWALLWFAAAAALAVAVLWRPPAGREPILPPGGRT